MYSGKFCSGDASSGVEWKRRGTAQHCPRGQLLPWGSDTRGNQDGNPHAEQLKAQEQRTSPQRWIRAEPHTGKEAALQSDRELLQPHQVTGDSPSVEAELSCAGLCQNLARAWTPREEPVPGPDSDTRHTNTHTCTYAQAWDKVKAFQLIKTAAKNTNHVYYFPYPPRICK